MYFTLLLPVLAMATEFEVRSLVPSTGNLAAQVKSVPLLAPYHNEG